MSSLAGGLQIAHYYPWVYLTSGIERTILQICRHSRHRHTVFTNRFEAENTYPELSACDVVELQRVSVQRSLPNVARAAAVIAGQSLPLQPFHLLIVHCDGLGDLVLARNYQVPAICFCHTPLRPVFDREYRKRALQRYRGVSRLPFNTFSLGFRRVDAWLWRRYRHVVFNSAETLQRARAGGLVGGDRPSFEVLHPGVDLDACVPTWRYEPYFLVPGRIMWTKNVELAIDAFLRFSRSAPAHAAFKLVVAGRVDVKSQAYLASLRQRAGTGGRVEFAVSPSDAEMRDLYANCLAVLFPSFNEDWGLVPLEANAYGKPVVATNVGGPTESQRDGVTGMLASPRPEAFASAMRQLADDPSLARSIGGTARAHAARFDSKDFVRRLDDLAERLVDDASAWRPRARRVG